MKNGNISIPLLTNKKNFGSIYRRKTFINKNTSGSKKLSIKNILNLISLNNINILPFYKKNSITCYILQEKWYQVCWEILLWTLQGDILLLVLIQSNKNKIKEYNPELWQVLTTGQNSNKEKQYLIKNRKISADIGHWKIINLSRLRKKTHWISSPRENPKRISPFLTTLLRDHLIQ